MHRFLLPFRSLLFGALLLAGALLFSGCDANSLDEDDSLNGTWTAVATVDWSESFALPAGASMDSVRYLHTGTHRLTFRLTDTEGTVSGTVDWDVDGLFTVNEYMVGNANTDVDDVDLNRAPEAVQGAYDTPRLTFERSGTTNDWLSPLDGVDLTLKAGELTGQLVFRYLVTEWPVPNSQSPFTTTFEFPVPFRLMRTDTPSTD